MRYVGIRRYQVLLALEGAKGIRRYYRHYEVPYEVCRH